MSTTTDTNTQQALDWPGTLVETDWLAANLGHPALRIIDMRGYVKTTLLGEGKQQAQYLGARDEYATGHIPGAVNAFWQGSVADEGRFRSPEEVRETFEALGVTDDNAVVYCGSGVVASQTILQLERAGFRPRLYAGGWSDWSQRIVRSGGE